MTVPPYLYDVVFHKKILPPEYPQIEFTHEVRLALCPFVGLEIRVGGKLQRIDRVEHCLEEFTTHCYLSSYRPVFFDKGMDRFGHPEVNLLKTMEACLAEVQFFTRLNWQSVEVMPILQLENFVLGLTDAN